MPSVLFHFSEDPALTLFEPHVPRTNPNEPSAVWAIDAEHSPLYWFPRQCPRVAAWPRDRSEVDGFRAMFVTVADRVHAVELAWLDRMRSTTLFRYTFDPADFEPWASASGQWVAHRPIQPITVEPVGDLLHAHVAAGIELRFVPSLWPVRDVAVGDRWDFSLVRMANARPRD